MYIAHLDADCFYVSAERVRYPYLRGSAAENRKHSPSIPKKPKAKKGSAAKKAAAPLKKASIRKANRTTKRVKKKS